MIFEFRKKIKVVDKRSDDERYSNGDVFEIAIITNNNDVYIDMHGQNPLRLIDDEWEFYEEYNPKKILDIWKK